jgi:hypothetical protein
MNFFQYLWFIVSGPLFAPTQYGDMLFFAFFFINKNYAKTYSTPVIIIVVISIHFLLNWYQQATATLVTNGIFTELDTETKNKISIIAHEEGVTIAKMNLVTNFSAPAIIVGRYKNNCEIYISQQWLETEESKTHLNTFLHKEIAGIANNQPWKFLIATTIVFAINISLVGLLSPIILTKLSHNALQLFIILGSLFQLCATSSLYLKGWIMRALEYQSDMYIAKKIGYDTLIDAINYFEKITKIDFAFGSLPTWKLAIQKNASRIKYLQQHYQK